jgi:hypothetical protein
MNLRNENNEKFAWVLSEYWKADVPLLANIWMPQPGETPHLWRGNVVIHRYL